MEGNGLTARTGRPQVGTQSGLPHPVLVLLRMVQPLSLVATG